MLPLPDHAAHPLILVADGRGLDTPGRVFSLAQSIRDHSRTAASIVCVVREDPETRLGRGRLWVGSARPGAARPPRSVTAALLVAMLQRFGLETKTLAAAATAAPEPSRIGDLLAQGMIVVVSDRGGGHGGLAATLGATEIVFHPDPAERSADRRVPLALRRNAATGGE
jgi:hypothetical protein